MVIGLNGHNGHLVISVNVVLNTNFVKDLVITLDLKQQENIVWGITTKPPLVAKETLRDVKSVRLDMLS